MRMKLINSSTKFTNVAFWLNLLITFLIFDYVKCKGTGVISASGGGGGDGMYFLILLILYNI